ncbi:hypothetical protein R9X47_10990 [Wukongibacter baidiensis]|uniref:hypothetical protein n=1 Tax=Wukongibacter baidiensis TaxID=1723361 RepID=UPI003D7FB1F5
MKKNNKVHIYYLLLGIGIGLALGGIIIFASPNVKYVEYTEEEIKQKARGLGMYELDEIFEMNDKFNEQVEKNIEKQNINLQNDDTKVEDSTENVAKNELEKDKIVEKTASEDFKAEEYTKFVIKEGESSEKVINNLFEEKIIEDKEQFRKLIYGRKVDRKLRYGIFMIPKGADNDTIIDILIR